MLDKNLGQGYVGQLKADEVLKNIDEDFAKVVKRIGTAKLKQDYKTYAAIMPNGHQAGLTARAPVRAPPRQASRAGGSEE